MPHESELTPRGHVAPDEKRRLQASEEYAVELEEMRLRKLVRAHNEHLWALLTRHRRYSGRLQFLANSMDMPTVAIKQSFMSAEDCSGSSPVWAGKQVDNHEADIDNNSGTDAILRTLFASVSSTHRSKISETLTLLSQPERKGPSEAMLESAKRQLLAALARLADRSTTPSACRREPHHISCSYAAIGTIVGKGGVNIKRIGAQFGCKIIFSPKLRCFIMNCDAESARNVKRELLKLETNFNKDQANWATEKARRRAEKQLSLELSLELHAGLHFPEPQDFKEEAAGLWHRHQRGKKKAKRRSQRIVIDYSRASTAPGGRRSKPMKLNSVGAKAMKRVLRSQTACRTKRPARGANSLVQVQMQMQPQGSEEPKASRRGITAVLGLSRPQRSVVRKKARSMKEKGAVESAGELFHPTISLDCDTQQQWDLLASSRRWRGLVQELINLLRPRFAGDAPFALKQSFALCDSNESTNSSRSRGGKFDAALLRLLAPAKPEAAWSDREHASRLRLARAVELLLGDVGQIKTTRARIASTTQPQPGPKPGIESEQKLSSELCAAPAAA